MLGENIRNARKSKGLTQAELADELHIVRQTVSKWEKNLSVPDADLMEKISFALETDIQTLLGTKSTAFETTHVTQDNDLSFQLSKLNEQIASKNRLARKILKIIGILLITLAILYLLWYVFGRTITIIESTSAVVTNIIS